MTEKEEDYVVGLERLEDNGGSTKKKKNNLFVPMKIGLFVGRTKLELPSMENESKPKGHYVGVKKRDNPYVDLEIYDDCISRQCLEVVNVSNDGMSTAAIILKRRQKDTLGHPRMPVTVYWKPKQSQKRKSRRTKKQSVKVIVAPKHTFTLLEGDILEILDANHRFRFVRKKSSSMPKPSKTKTLRRSKKRKALSNSHQIPKKKSRHDTGPAGEFAGIKCLTIWSDRQFLATLSLTDDISDEEDESVVFSDQSSEASVPHSDKELSVLDKEDGTEEGEKLHQSDVIPLALTLSGVEDTGSTVPSSDHRARPRKAKMDPSEVMRPLTNDTAGVSLACNKSQQLALEDLPHTARISGWLQLPTRMWSSRIFFNGQSWDIGIFESEEDAKKSFRSMKEKISEWEEEMDQQTQSKTAGDFFDRMRCLTLKQLTKEFVSTMSPKDRNGNVTGNSGPENPSYDRQSSKLTASATISPSSIDDSNTASKQREFETERRNSYDGDYIKTKQVGKAQSGGKSLGAKKAKGANVTPPTTTVEPKVTAAPSTTVAARPARSAERKKPLDLPTTVAPPTTFATSHAFSASSSQLLNQVNPLQFGIPLLSRPTIVFNQWPNVPPALPYYPLLRPGYPPFHPSEYHPNDPRFHQGFPYT